MREHSRAVLTAFLDGESVDRDFRVGNDPTMVAFKDASRVGIDSLTVGFLERADSLCMSRSNYAWSKKWINNQTVVFSKMRVDQIAEKVPGP